MSAQLNINDYHMRDLDESDRCKIRMYDTIVDQMRGVVEQ